MARFCRWLIVLVVLAIISSGLYVWLWPPPIKPAAYHPPAPPAMEGVLAPNEDLESAEILARGLLPGPEDVVVGADGYTYAGCADGTIRRLRPDGEVDVFVNTKGRPLGIQMDAGGNLIVCDAVRGLLKVNPIGAITVLASRAGGAPIKVANELDIASDGRVFFSDCSAGFPVEGYLYDLLEARPSGRLLVYDPRTGSTAVLLDKLFYANGVALSPGQDYVLVVETYAYRITRYWLKGPRAGQSEVFCDNLPGFPDNLSRGTGGVFWLAMFTVRNPLMDWMHPRPWAKRLLSKLPGFLWPSPQPYGLVLGIDGSGQIVRSLQDPDGRRVSNVTSARQFGDWLYLGSLYNNYVARLKLNAQ